MPGSILETRIIPTRVDPPPEHGRIERRRPVGIECRKPEIRNPAGSEDMPLFRSTHAAIISYAGSDRRLSQCFAVRAFPQVLEPEITVWELRAIGYSSTGAKSVPRRRPRTRLASGPVLLLFRNDA